MREPASCRHCTGHPRLADAPSASKLISPTSNNRWLAVLEHDVKLLLGSLVLGGEQTLLPSAQPLLATWAVKTALMLDPSGGQPLIPTGFYHDFQLQRSPLPSQIVWIGAYRDSTRAAWARHDGLHVGISADEPPNAFSTTFDGIASTVAGSGRRPRQGRARRRWGSHGAAGLERWLGR